jgi:DNA polymerase-3 subunit delta'
VPDAVHLANGNFIKAKTYINPGEDEQFYFQKFQEMMRQAYKREVVAQIQWAEEMAKIGRDKQKAFFAFALRMIREYFVLNMKRSNMVYLNRQEKEWGKQFAPFINERNIVAFFNEFETGIKHISWNGNPRIIFLDTALRMVRLIKR